MLLKPEQFTEQAREVLQNSQELVRRYRHSQWDVEHILLALLALERGLPAEILNELGIAPDAVKARLGRTLEAAAKLAYDSNQIYATPRATRLLESAKAEADRLKDEFIGTEHLFVAAVMDTQGASAQHDQLLDQHRSLHSQPAQGLLRRPVVQADGRPRAAQRVAEHARDDRGCRGGHDHLRRA